MPTYRYIYVGLALDTFINAGKKTTGWCTRRQWDGQPPRYEGGFLICENPFDAIYHAVEKTISLAKDKTFYEIHLPEEYFTQFPDLATAEFDVPAITVGAFISKSLKVKSPAHDQQNLQDLVLKHFVRFHKDSPKDYLHYLCGEARTRLVKGKVHYLAEEKSKRLGMQA